MSQSRSHAPVRHLRRFLVPAAALGCVAVMTAIVGTGPREIPQAVAPPENFPAADFTLSGIVTRIEQVRKLTFKPAPRFAAAAPGEIARLHLEAVRNAVPATELALRRQAWCALGFRWEPDWPAAEAIAGMNADQWGCYFDRTQNTVFCEAEDLPAPRADRLPKLTAALAGILLMQHHGFPAPMLSANDDGQLAQAAVIAAEASQVSLLSLLNAPAPAVAAAPDPFYAVPRFLRELLLYPRNSGPVLAAAWNPGGPDFTAFDRIHAHPPGSTAALWNSDTAPDFSPPALPGKTPALTGVLGSFGIELLLKSQLTREAATAASSGWAGDHYQLYTLAGGAGDGLLWEVRWQKPETAAAFAVAMAETLRLAHGLEDATLTRVPDGFAASHSRRCFRIFRAPDSGTVFTLTSSSPAFLTAAESLLPGPAALATTSLPTP